MSICADGAIERRCAAQRQTVLWFSDMSKPITYINLLVAAIALTKPDAAAPVSTPASAGSPTMRVGAATAEMEADDSMVIGGGIGPGKLTGQEGKLQATAVVLSGNTKLCLVGVDVLMMNRDLLDEAARRIEKECRI